MGISIASFWKKCHVELVAGDKLVVVICYVMKLLWREQKSVFYRGAWRAPFAFQNYNHQRSFRSNARFHQGDAEAAMGEPEQYAHRKRMLAAVFLTLNALGFAHFVALCFEFVFVDGASVLGFYDAQYQH